MAKTKTFTVFSDPGHAWVKVDKAFLKKIFGDDWRREFTRCSFETLNHAFLEEDCDATTLLKKLSECGIVARFNERSTNKQSRIRNYQRLQ